jgi:hypothetical protein
LVIGYTVFDSVIGVYAMRRAQPALRANLRAAGLIDEAENFAAALRLIGLGLSTLGYDGGAVGANALEISKRLDALKSLVTRA